MRKFALIIVVLFFSSTAWGGSFWDEVARGMNDPPRDDTTVEEILQGQAERKYMRRQTEIEQQRVDQEQERINIEKQMLLQQQWQLFKQQQQLLTQTQLEQQKKLRLRLQQQKLLQKRREFIEAYLLASSDNLANEYAVFRTKISSVFHKPNCSKLVAMDGLIRFDTRQEASEEGCLPCNYCKP